MKTYTKRVSALVVALLMLISAFSMGALAWNANDGIEVYWNGSYVTTVKYDDMDTAISPTTDKTYAGINNYGTYKSYTGKVYTLDQLIAAVSKTNDWASAPDTTMVTIQTSPSETANYTKAQLTETRNYYDASGAIVTSVPVGFMKRTGEGGNYFKFVFGQTAQTEKNVPKFWDFPTTGNAQIYFDTNATPTQVGTIYAQVNGTGTVYAPNSVIVVQEGDTIQFNYYDSNYLNTTMIYYTWGDENDEIPDPGVNDSSECYITQAPMYGGVFNPFEADGTFYWNKVKVIGVRYGCTDSDVFSFNIRITGT